MSHSSPETLRNGRYVIVGMLGEGAQGATLDAVDKLRGRPVAIKRFQVRGAKSWKDVELAEREARVLASIDHPGLPAYVEHFEEDGCLCLVMEKIDGERLSARRERGAHFSQADVVRFLADASDALDYLHGRAPPIIHRDIKPSNVIQRPDGSFALVDFGAVRDCLRPEGGSTVVGTFGYMAPEQFQSRAMPASDVYAVGTTALCMLTGREPEDLPHQGLGIDVPRALAGHVDPALVRLLSALVVPDPDQRASRIAPWLPTLSRPSPNAAPPPAAGHAAPPLGTENPATDSGFPSRFPSAGRRGRRHRHRGWGPRHGFGAPHHPLSNPFVVVAALLGLTVAQLAVFVGLRVVGPLVLTVLALVFGDALRRAAHAMHGAGLRAHRGLQHAGEVVRERSARAASDRYPARNEARRARVGGPPHEAPHRPRVRMDDPSSDTWAPADDELEMPRRRRRG